MKHHYAPPATDQFIRNAQGDAVRLGVSDEVWNAFRSHFNSSKRRKIDFKFSLEEWWAWWQTDDRWASRGVGKDKLVMARHGDTGPYSPENVFCTTHTDNILNMGDASKAIQRKKLVESWVGRECHLTGKREDHPMAKAVLTPQGLFGNASLAAEAFGITRQAASTRARTGNFGWHYVADLEKVSLTERRKQTDIPIVGIES